MQRKLRKDEKSDKRKWTKRVCFSDEHEIEQTKGEERYEGGEMRVEGGEIKKTEEKKRKRNGIGRRRRKGRRKNGSR